MSSNVTGIHHLTAIASDAGGNIDFYAGVLGLRLVKRTVNFDDPGVYHFYFGDNRGTPGSLLTFFPYAGLVKGRAGTGMATTAALALPASALVFWKERLDRFSVQFRETEDPFEGAPLLHLEDEDGLGLSLVFTEVDAPPAPLRGPVPPEYGVRGIHHVVLTEEGFQSTADLLTGVLGHRQLAARGNRFRFGVGEKQAGYVDVICAPGGLKGLRGSGTFHHVAFAVPNATTQQGLRDALVTGGFNVTPVLDRKYFSSCYFREPGGVLLEIATGGPGFTIDEPADHLGESLLWPAGLEDRQEALSRLLPPVEFDMERFR